jgi:hypothetical protein
MDPITTSFINAFNMLKRRLANMTESNLELEMINNVSRIFGPDVPMILTIKRDAVQTKVNKKFVKAVEELERYHKEQTKIVNEEARLLQIIRQYHTDKNHLASRKAEQTKLSNKLFETFNTETKENFILTPHMQISFKYLFN